jgi:hypothetical protein
MAGDPRPGVIGAIALAGLSERALLERLAAIARRLSDPPSVDQVTAIVDAAHLTLENRESFVAAVKAIARRQWSRHRRRTEGSAAAELQIAHRKERIAVRLLGKPERWAREGYYASIELRRPCLLLAIARSSYADTARPVLVYRIGSFRPQAVPVPKAITSCREALVWLVADDLPDSPASGALGAWLLENVRLTASGQEV